MGQYYKAIAFCDLYASHIHWGLGALLLHNNWIPYRIFPVKDYIKYLHASMFSVILTETNPLP